MRWFRRKQWSYSGFAEKLAPGDDGFDLEMGWKAHLHRGDEDHMDTRWVWVIVAPGTVGARDLPRVARRAIQTNGHTVMESIRHLDEPPRVLIVDETGVHPQ